MSFGVVTLPLQEPCLLQVTEGFYKSRIICHSIAHMCRVWTRTSLKMKQVAPL